jgi:hypothetical protein
MAKEPMFWNETGQDIIEDINNSNNNKFIVRFSNFPNFTGHRLNMNNLNQYLESITIPDISIPMLSSIYNHERQLHPATIGQRDLQTLTITFQVDEARKNWYAFYSWMWYMRHGQTCGKTNLKGEELVRMDCIDTIEVINLTNNGEVVSKLKFGHCILNNVSSTEFTCQSSELSKFTVTFEVETVDLDLLTNEE